MPLRKRQELMYRLGPRLRELRSHRLITQKTLGEAAGVSGAQVGRYEAGLDLPNFEQALLIMEKLEIWTIDWLVPPGSPLPPRRKRRKLNEYVTSFYWPDPLEILLQLSLEFVREVQSSDHVKASADWVAAIKDRMGVAVTTPKERAARHKRMVARIEQRAAISEPQAPVRLGFYGRDARSTESFDADTAVKAACGLPPDAPSQQAWDRWLNRIHSDDRPRVQAELVRLKTDGVFEMQYRLLGCDGVERYILDHGHMICDDRTSQQIRLHGTMIDVTHLPRSKSGEEAIRQFLAGNS